MLNAPGPFFEQIRYVSYVLLCIDGGIFSSLEMLDFGTLRTMGKRCVVCPCKNGLLTIFCSRWNEESSAAAAQHRAQNCGGQGEGITLLYTGEQTSTETNRQIHSHHCSYDQTIIQLISILLTHVYVHSLLALSRQTKPSLFNFRFSLLCLCIHSLYEPLFSRSS